MCKFDVWTGSRCSVVSSVGRIRGRELRMLWRADWYAAMAKRGYRLLQQGVQVLSDNEPEAGTTERNSKLAAFSSALHPLRFSSIENYHRSLHLSTLIRKARSPTAATIEQKQTSTNDWQNSLNIYVGSNDTIMWLVSNKHCFCLWIYFTTPVNYITSI